MVYGSFNEDSERLWTLGRHPTDRKKIAVLPNRPAGCHSLLGGQAFPGIYPAAPTPGNRPHPSNPGAHGVPHPVAGGLARRKHYLSGGPMPPRGKIGFVHPRTGEYLEFEAPLPAYHGVSPKAEGSVNHGPSHGAACGRRCHWSVDGPVFLAALALPGHGGGMPVRRLCLPWSCPPEPAGESLHFQRGPRRFWWRRASTQHGHLGGAGPPSRRRPAIAQRIIDYREQNSGFYDIEELMDVSGIGEKTFAKLEPYITVE